MHPRLREIPLLYAYSSGLTALLAIPPGLALWAWTDESTIQILQQHLVSAERGVGFALLTLCLIFVLRHAHRRRLVHQLEEPVNAGHSETRHANESTSHFGFTALQFLAIFAPAVPLLAYLWIFNDLAYEHLFLGDQDFTNISTAINQTARFQGFLTTPFLATGPTGSYLGHHFSPLLVLYAPAYWLADAIFAGSETRPTHLIYAVCLWFTLAAGLLLWARLIQKELRNPFTATACMALICGAYPLWRLALSYHYELPVIPLSALTFLALGKWKAERRFNFFWLWLILWMANKEDIALYVILFAVYLATHRGESPRTSPVAHFTRAITIIVVALAWLFVAVWAMDSIGGSERVDWVKLWSEPTPDSEHSLRPGLFLLLAFALLPALSVRYFWIVLVPLLLFHFLSRQIWHHNFLGHYSYAILPFLMFGALRGLQRLESGIQFWREAWGPVQNPELSPQISLHRPAMSVPFVILIALLSLSFFAASVDRYMPLPRLGPDPRFAAVEAILQKIPAGACLQTQSPFSAHTPLDVQVYPLMAPKNNPAHDRMPGPQNFTRFYFNEHSCQGYYLLLDPGDAMPPFYTQQHLAAFEGFAEKNLTLVWRTAYAAEGAGAETASRELKLYRLSVF